jgi:choline kinase
MTAIILTAVFFSKSELFDPLLKLGGTTVLDRQVNTFRDAGVNDIIVVLNERTVEFAPVLAQAEIHWVLDELSRGLDDLFIESSPGIPGCQE